MEQLDKLGVCQLDVAPHSLVLAIIPLCLVQIAISILATSVILLLAIHLLLLLLLLKLEQLLLLLRCHLLEHERLLFLISLLECGEQLLGNNLVLILLHLGVALLHAGVHELMAVPLFILW